MIQQQDGAVENIKIPRFGGGAASVLQAYRGVVGSMRGEDTIFQSFVAFVGMSL